MSCQCVKNTGWPASDGVPGIVALPSAPWQAAHGVGLAAPGLESAAAARGCHGRHARHEERAPPDPGRERGPKRPGPVRRLQLLVA